ncbi:hypothetical protein [Nitratiruptor sp. SB155-2]|uniref:hypothetical protein n=1 Tax=Nitratiruptor sp. (strain SB155-2) TaxID=387092 RepID=UPI0002E32116|nr:hypothetical protein [Nitratiruptor sp. SB155-2]
MMPQRGEIWYRKRYNREGCKRVKVVGVDDKFIHIIDDEKNDFSVLKENWHEHFSKSESETIAKAEQTTA